MRLQGGLDGNNLQTIGFIYNNTIYSYLDNPVLCENRIKIRVLNGGHDIPKEDIVRRFYRSKKNFWYIYKNLVDQWTIFNNGASEYIPVAQYVNGTIEIFNEQLYNKFIKEFI